MERELYIEGAEATDPAAQRALAAAKAIFAVSRADPWEAACASFQRLLSDLGEPDCCEGQWTEEHHRLADLWDEAGDVAANILSGGDPFRFMGGGPGLALRDIG